MDCRQRLVFKDFPPGYSITVYAVSVSGNVELEGGAFLERAEVAVEYFPVGFSFFPFYIPLRSSVLSFFSTLLTGRTGKGGCLCATTNFLFAIKASSNETSEVDVAVDADMRSRYASVYDGPFSLTMNIFSDGNDTKRGQTRCATADAQPGLELRVRLSSSYDRVGGGDNDVAGRASLRDVRVGFHVDWGRCES
jgi:hypothetical protein